MASKRVNSADSHVLEPVDLWSHTMPARLAERAPRSERQGNRELLFVDGEVVRRDPIAFTEATRPPGAYDPKVRLTDLDSQGIWAELVFPSKGLWVPLLRDRDVASACCRGYNEWLSSEILPMSPRFVGVAMLSALHTADAVSELRRAVDLGYRAVFLPAASPPGRDYNDEVWEPLWAAADDAKVVVCFHAGSGSNPIVNRGPGGAVINYVETFFPVQRTLAQLVASGVLDSHPTLRFVFVEGGASWLPSMMDRMDESYRQHGMFVRPQLSMLPSELMLRQVAATFQHDRGIKAAVQVTGTKPIMWGSDYPHLEGTFPHTQKVLEEVFEGVDEEARRAVTADNFAALFGAPPEPADEW